MTIEVIKTEEEAREYLNLIKNKLGLIDLDKLLSKNDENIDDNYKKYEQKVIDGIRLGLIYFDESMNCIVQKLITQISFNNNMQDTIEFCKSLKIKNIKSINNISEFDMTMKNIGILTNEKIEKLEELTPQDFNFTVAITLVFYI